MISLPILVLVFVGGVLAIASPCVLPIVPLLFSRADRTFARYTVPMLAGLATTFAVIASLATVAIGWIATANVAGRWLALGLLGALGLSLLSDGFASRLSRPLVALGARLGARESTSVMGSFAVGAATGLLWAPCAGPILGLVVAATAVSGAGLRTTLLYFDFALGAATALGIVLYFGGHMLNRLLARGATERGIRRALGALTLATVLLIAFGADRTLLARVGFAQTTGAEQALIDRFAPKPAPPAHVATPTAAVVADGLPPTDEGMMHGFTGATKWLNGGPLTPDVLKGKVVLVEFWTFECINCLNALPYVKALYAKYKDRGFTIVGVHTPELPAERAVSNVQQQVRDLGITFPVVIDNDYKIWNAWGNEYWPALYVVDAHGRVRYHHFGEGAYDEEDRVVQKLLYEAGR